MRIDDFFIRLDAGPACWTEAFEPVDELAIYMAVDEAAEPSHSFTIHDDLEDDEERRSP